MIKDLSEAEVKFVIIRLVWPLGGAGADEAKLMKKQRKVAPYPQELI